MMMLHVKRSEFRVESLPNGDRQVTLERNLDRINVLIPFAVIKSEVAIEVSRGGGVAAGYREEREYNTAIPLPRR
jgi:hypothetical protein